MTVTPTPAPTPMHQATQFSAPTAMRWGPGCRSALPSVVDEVGGRRALLIGSRRFLLSDLGADLQATLGTTLVAVHAHRGGEPDCDDAHAVARLAAEHHTDCFVAVGGGSVFGLTKCAAVDLASGGGFERFSWTVDPATSTISVPRLPAGAPPIVAVPTTAGTGSDVNGLGSVLDRGRNEKVAMRGWAVAPRVSLMDPELGVTAGPRLTTGAGLNALSHCVEVLYSRQAQPVSRALALEGARLIGESLPRCVADGGDLAAREAMLLASALSSMAFANAMLGLHSALCHALSAVSDVAYPDAQSVVFPHALRYRSDVIEPAARGVCDAMGLATNVGTRAAHQLATWAEERLAGPRRLRDIGVEHQELPALAHAAFGDRCIGYDPRSVPDAGTLLDLYQQAW